VYNKDVFLEDVREHHGEVREYSESTKAVESVFVDVEHVAHWCEWDPEGFIFQLEADEILECSCSRAPIVHEETYTIAGICNMSLAEIAVSTAAVGSVVLHSKQACSNDCWADIDTTSGPAGSRHDAFGAYDHKSPSYILEPSSRHASGVVADCVCGFAATLAASGGTVAGGCKPHSWKMHPMCMGMGTAIARKASGTT